MLVRALSFVAPFDRLTHYAFRYPAKFHPPVARHLIENYSKISDRVIDPFCGSGTLLVEGVKTGRRMYGIDVDPVASFVARIKSTPIAEPGIFKQLGRFIDRALQSDLGKPHDAWVPAIPNISHWFEDHVLEEMAALNALISRSRVLSPQAKEIAQCAFLGCVRNWSNADPVPVSGLEVTKHIRLKRANGFFPDVRAQFTNALKRLNVALREFSTSSGRLTFCPTVVNSDAYDFFRSTRRRFDALITSPPYLTAVDYYRRHTLEMYWLDARMTPTRRLALRNQYIGQASVNVAMGQSTKGTELSRRTRRLGEQIEAIDPKKARAFRHYFGSMKRTLLAAMDCLKDDASLVLVLGDSYLAGEKIPTSELLTEELAPCARLQHISEYPLKNRYMTYARHNDADIGTERILAFQKNT